MVLSNTILGRLMLKDEEQEQKEFTLEKGGPSWQIVSMLYMYFLFYQHSFWFKQSENKK